MAEIAKYDDEFNGVIYSDADVGFGIYMARFLNDGEETFRFNITTPQQGVNPGTCLSSQPLSPQMFVDGVATIVRLLKKTKSWPQAKERIAALLED